MRDEIGFRQDASGAVVVDPRQTGATQSGSQFSPHPLGTPHFFASAASRHWHDKPYRAARRFWPNAKK